MQRYFGKMLKLMHMKFEQILDFRAEQSARRALTKLLIQEGAIPDRRSAAAFFARCSRITGEADILEAVYKLGNSNNHRKYKRFLTKHRRRIEILYHACFSE